MTTHSKHVRFAENNTVHPPPPAYSLLSPSSSGAQSPPLNHPAALQAPGPTPYHFTVAPSPNAHAHPRTRVYHSSHPRLHPTLAGPTPAIQYDFTYSPSTPSLRILSPGISSHFYAEPATHPPLLTMTITSPYLPWTITVTPSTTRHTAFITVSDVLYAIHHTLRQTIRVSEFEVCSERKRVKRAYEDRYRALRASGAAGEAEEEKRQGVRRLDFLVGKTRFMGLSATADPTVWTLISA